MKPGLGVLFSAALFSTTVLTVGQSVVYDNATNAVFSGGQQLFYSSANNYGDEITLAGTDRTLTSMQLYYYFSGAAPGTASAIVRLYDNTGTLPAGSPGGLLFTSDPITLSPGYNNQGIDFTTANPAVTVPDTFTWTIQFSNLGTDQAGLLVYSPPTVGTSPSDFWEFVGGSWQTMGITGQPRADFAAQFTAVPEPGVLSLGALALLAGIGAARSRKLRA